MGRQRPLYLLFNKIKEMTSETKRTVLLFAGSSFVSVATVIISFGLYAGRDENKIIDQKLEQKVDKVQYKEDCENMDERVKRMENTYDLLIEIKTDVKWLKEKEQKTTRQ
jgi:hypothetical protein